MRLLGVQRIEDLGMQHVSGTRHDCRSYIMVRNLTFDRSTPEQWNATSTMARTDWSDRAYGRRRRRRQNCEDAMQAGWTGNGTGHEMFYSNIIIRIWILLICGSIHFDNQLIVLQCCRARGSEWIPLAIVP